MECLQPLAVLHVRLPLWDLVCVLGINQPDVKTTLCEHFEQGNAVDAGRLHHHGLNLTLAQPFGEGLEISRKRPKALHRLLIAIMENGYPATYTPTSIPAALRCLCVHGAACA